MPEVTVLTAVRNGMPYLPETLESIQQQTFTDWEYILVDDSSTDETPQVIEAAAKRDQRIKLLRRCTAGGPFIAANDGLRVAAGVYVVRTDADDLSLPTRIEKQIAFLKANPSLRASGTYAQMFDRNGLQPNRIARPLLLPGSLKWELVVRCSLIHSTACVVRETLADVYTHSPLYDTYKAAGEVLASQPGQVVPDVEDYRMWCRVARPHLLGVIPEILVHRRIHKRSITVLRHTDQLRLYMGVLREHAALVTGTPVDEKTVSELAKIGLMAAVPLHSGLARLCQWDAWWQADASLTDDEKQELNAFSGILRRRFMRTQLSHQPVQFLRHLDQFVFPYPHRPCAAANYQTVKE